MEDQTIEILEPVEDVETVEAAETVEAQAPEKKKLPKNLVLPVTAMALVVGAALVEIFMTIIFPIVYNVVDFVLWLLGLIPIIGIPFNLVSMLLSGVYFVISLVNPLIWVLSFCAIIAGIVVGIMALVKSLKNPESADSTLEKLLSIGAIVLGALLIFAMIFMLIVSIVSTIISIMLSIVGFVLDIVSLFMG